MLRPSMYDIINENQCYYSFVLAVAKRAREIVDEYNEKEEILEIKPVDIAVGQFANGEYKFEEETIEDIEDIQDIEDTEETIEDIQNIENVENTKAAEDIQENI